MKQLFITGQTFLFLIPFCVAPLTTEARDLIPTDTKPGTGSYAIISHLAVQGKIQGKTIQFCSYDQSKNTYSNCQNIGSRTFYSNEEIDLINKQLDAEKTQTNTDIAKSGAAGLVLGALVGVAIIAVTFGSATPLVVAAFAGAAAGTAVGTIGTKPKLSNTQFKQGIALTQTIRMTQQEVYDAHWDLMKRLNALDYGSRGVAQTASGAYPEMGTSSNPVIAEPVANPAK